MKLKALLLPVLALVVFAGAHVYAQPADQGMKQRLELARKMHQIRPLDVQIEAAIKQISMRYPAEKRELFVKKMLETFDQNTLTEISVKAMADTFTAAELEKLIEFNSSPEGKAITEKMPIYQGLVAPELSKRVDKALLELRTGKAPE